MVNKNSKLCFLSGNALKIIAAVFMLIDHIGYILFPQYEILRIIGRMSFPIFAFMIAEGCYYTKNKLRYFLGIFSLAIVCQIAYYIFDESFDMGILITFSLSILMIYSLEYFKKKLFSSDTTFKERLLALGIFALTVAIVYLLNRYLSIDYGFWGCMIPVFASVFRTRRKTLPDRLQKFDCLVVHVFMMTVGLVILSLAVAGNQFYSLLAIPLLLTYSGKRGKINMKNFFYIFYPAHLVVLQAISMLLK